MRNPRATILAVLVGGLLALAAVALLRGSSLAFTLGVPDNAPVVSVVKGRGFCQRDIMPAAGARFDRIQATIGTYGHRGARLLVTVRDRRGAVLARGVLPGGYPDISSQPHQVIRLDATVTPQDGMSVCVRTVEARRVAFYGAADGAAVPTTVELDDGKRPGVDANLIFLGPHRSFLAQLGDISDRARLFRGGPLLPGWAYLLVVALLLSGASAALVATAGSLVDEDDEDDEGRSPPP